MPADGYQPKGFFACWKFRLISLLVAQVFAIVWVGLERVWRLGIHPFFTPLVLAGSIYTVFLPYLRNESIIAGAVFEAKGDEVNHLARQVYVLIASAVVALFLFE